MNGRQLARRKYVTALYVAQAGECCYCEKPMLVLGDISQRRFAQIYGLSARQVRHRLATIEHLRRRADGGGHDRDNLALACAFCNSKRQDMSWVEFKSQRMRSPMLKAMREPLPTVRKSLNYPRQDDRPDPRQLVERRHEGPSRTVHSARGVLLPKFPVKH